MARKPKTEETKYRCKDCRLSYDWHEKDYKGDVFLCKCPFYKEGRFYKFLDDKQCENFKLR